MTKSKTTKRALLSSCVALMLCFSMLLGTTYAWFTDEVTSNNNIIKSGTLDAEMNWKAKLSDEWTDASEGPIFTYEYWEPGYVDVKYIQLVNAGDLAFNYQLRVVPENAVSDGMKLAEVIDVYVAPGDTTIERKDISGMIKLGTLKELMIQPTGVDDGVLLPVEGNTQHIDLSQITDEYYTGDVALCVALKMQEDAGNEYQNLSIGDGFAVKLLATQYTYEEDSFDHMYDEWAEGAPPIARVETTGAKMVNTSTHGEVFANTTFQFLPTQSLGDAQKSPYRYYHADFVVSADKDIPANAVILPGYYSAYCDGYNGGKWVGMSSDQTITAGTEIRLVDSLAGLLGGTVTVNYEEICKWGNDNVGFLCGIAVEDAKAVAGTTITVELRIYETTGDPSTDSGSKNEETGKYITIGTYTYTIPAYEVANQDDLKDALEDGVPHVKLAAGNYTFPASSLKAGTTLECEEGTVFEGNSKLNIDGATVIGATFSNPSGTAADQTINGTFKDCTFTGSNGLRWAYAGETVEFENCVFDGDLYGVHFDGGANEANFKNCTFSGFNAMGGAITKLTMEGCTFKANGKSSYNGINLWGDTEMIDCTFVFDGTVTEWIDMCGDNKTGTFTNCVISDGTTERALAVSDVGDYGTGNTITVK